MFSPSTFIPHTSADRRAGAVGDIQVLNERGRIFEAVEVKHDMPITLDMIREAYTKFKTFQSLERSMKHDIGIAKHYLADTIKQEYSSLNNL